MKSQKFDRIVEHVRARSDGEVSLQDVMSLAEVTVGSVQSFFETVDKAACREITEIAASIAKAKSEIGNLQARDMREGRIPGAGLELDAVVQATEDATNTIMEQAERIMEADASETDAYQATINDAVIQIFEACTFQDITGQRISKVVETLQHIDQRISQFVAAVGVDDAEGPMSDEEAARDARKRDLMLNGPQHAGEGVDQADVDEMLASPGDVPEEQAAGKSAQAAIDDLF